MSGFATIDLPAFTPPFTGAELVAADTNKTGGAAPLTVSLSPKQLAVAGCGGAVDLGTASGTVTIDCTAGAVFLVTLASNVDLELADPSPGQVVILEFTQADAGGWTVSDWLSTVKWAGGTAPTFTTGANAVDIVTLRWNEVAQAWRGSFANDFS